MPWPFDLSGMLKNVSKIKLPGGVVGKTTMAMMVVLLSVVGLAGFSRNDLIIGCTIGMVGLILSIFVWRLINFADKNPQAALLEGAEFLVHEKIAMASKNEPGILINVESQEIGKKVLISPQETKMLAQPDSIENILPPPEAP